MSDDVRLLEDLVDRAVERLRRFSEERDQLELETRELRERVDRENDGVASAFRDERGQIVAELRQTLVDLRGV